MFFLLARHVRKQRGVFLCASIGQALADQSLLNRLTIVCYCSQPPRSDSLPKLASLNSVPLHRNVVVHSHTGLCFSGSAAGRPSGRRKKFGPGRKHSLIELIDVRARSSGTHPKIESETPTSAEMSELGLMIFSYPIYTNWEV